MSEQVFIGQDERYPFFHLTDSKYDEGAEVPSETLARWRQVLDAFEVVQDEMQAVFDEAKARNARAAAIAKAEKVARDAQAKLDALRNQAP